MAALLVCALTVISLWGHGVSGSAKSEFLQRLKAETRGELGSLSTATAQNEYADYVERFGKLSGYMASDFDVKAHYAAYQENAAEIVRLNAAAQHEDEHYSINAFTDMTMEEKMAMLIPLEEFASRRRMGWDDVDCITVSPRSLPTDASRRSDTEMAQNACGRVKSQGQLGSCWYVAVDCIVSRDRQHALDPLLRSKGRSRRPGSFSAITTRRWPATKCSAKSMPPTVPTTASAPSTAEDFRTN